MLGAVLVVGAYVAYQQNQLRLDSVQFLGMNTLGAAILSVVAALHGDYGFLLLEGVWTWVAARGLRRAIKANRALKAKEKRKGGPPSGRFSRPAGRSAGGRRRNNPLRRV